MTPTGKANARVMLDIFSALERRDPQRLARLCHPDVEFWWPPALPYGGTARGLGTQPPTWFHTWAPLQPTEAERSMDPRVVASEGDEVVVHWRQRGAPRLTFRHATFDEDPRYPELERARKGGGFAKKPAAPRSPRPP